MTDIERLLRAAASEAGAGHDQAAPFAGSGPASPLPSLTLPDSLVDVAYTLADSPVGTLLLASTRRGLVRLAYLDDERGAEPVLQELSDRVSPRVVHRAAALDGVRRELDEFFAGARREFDVALDWRLTRGFTAAVLRATARIPFGERSSYKRVATAAGSPNAYRAAGTALGANPLAIVVPCHRVLHSDGGIGGYAGGTERKLTLLEIEGFTPIKR